ncbi:MAG TPA: hypothetical protein VGH79_00795 [Gaiellaceae bacterium]|jgi:hypothetical protein
MKIKHLLATAGLMAVAALTVTAVAFGGGNKSVVCHGGKSVVNVTYRLRNDYDSGVGGNAWANDTVKRQLRVFKLKGGSYCAIAHDTGSFVTFAGTSPAGTSTVQAGIKGVLHGGYTTTVFSGTLAAKPQYKKHGNLGTFDLECTDANTCPGAYPSYSSYFSSTSGDDLATWGWMYHTAKNGNWKNTYTGNAGDIKG